MPENIEIDRDLNVEPRPQPMSLRSKTAFHLAAGGLAAAVALATPSAQAEGAGPFEILAGSWSGNGIVNTSDGLHERVRCVAKYVSQNSGHSLGIDLRCASDSYKVEFTGSIVQAGDALSGNWFERTNRVGGRISGRANGNQIDVRADGDTFTALLTLKTQGGRQMFSMSSPGAKLSQFSIALNRAAR
jgi:hypothetical protein